ncbi:MAG: nicotinate phosphoribosyltransferase [Clostridiales bacterium]|nr:nicotinate phosphoribosyltransferase [Clostridiales bacterium]
MINKNEKYNLMMDFYELAMANGFISNGMKDTTAWFDMFFRPSKDIGGFCIMAGVEQLSQCLSSIEFDDDDIDFLRENGVGEAFLDYLKNFEFKCDVWAVPEGTPIFPGEPIVKVKGPILQALMIETMLLLTINHQTLIATKANRVVRAAQGRSIIEAGSRRAHGAQAALLGARAAYIGGCRATTNAQAAKMFDIPLFGGMSHSWIQAFNSEYEAFCAYAAEYPENCILLVDTYDTINSGIPNAIEAFKKVLLPKGYRPKGVRIDSGDLAYLSKKIRHMLNDAGFPDCDIYASNSLDEYIIREMLGHGARVDDFLVGERMITSADAPVFGGVYKMSAIEKDGKILNKIKISENVSKITTPCPKLLWRLFDMETGKAIADLLTLENENISELTQYELFDPDYAWKKKTVSNFVARQLLVPVFKNGKKVYASPLLSDIRAYCAEQVDTLWEEVLRFEYPHNYYVDLSKPLWDEKQRLINDSRNTRNG